MMNDTLIQNLTKIEDNLMANEKANKGKSVAYLSAMLRQIAQRVDGETLDWLVEHAKYHEEYSRAHFPKY